MRRIGTRLGSAIRMRMLTILRPTIWIRIHLRTPIPTPTNNATTRRSRPCRRGLPSCSTRARCVVVPGLAARSLGFSGLLKMFRSTSRRVGAPVRLPEPRLPMVAPVPRLSISAGTGTTVGSEKGDEPKGPMRPTAGVVGTSAGVRKITYELRSPRRGL